MNRQLSSYFYQNTATLVFRDREKLRTFAAGNKDKIR